MKLRVKKLSRPEQYDVRRAREAGATVAECALMKNVSEATVMRVLRDLRKVFGPEEIPLKHRARIPLTARSTQAMNVNELSEQSRQSA